MKLLIGSTCLLVIIFIGGLFTAPKKKVQKGDLIERLFGPGVDFIQKFVRKEDVLFRKSMPKILCIIWILHLLVFFLIMSGFVVLGDVSVSRVERNSYSGGEKREKLIVETEDGEELEMEVVVAGREYSDEEIDDFFSQAKEKLPRLILGENQSLKKVSSELNLVTAIEGNPVEIDWEPLPENPEEMSEVVAILTYKEREERFSIAVQYVEPEKTREEKLKAEIEKELEKQDEKSRNGQYLELPAKVGEDTINWLRKGSGNVDGMVLFIFLLGFLLFWKEKEGQQKQEEIKKSRMVLEYPELVSKLTLLLGAGMTLQRAWEKIATEYKEKRERGSISKYYAYEEMYITFKQMESGVPLKSAIDAFGKRIGIPRYLKFSTLLSQNLRRGSSGLLERLEIEAVDSFEERKAIARQMGERASTKLLFPMILMLVIVMVLIMVPAFFSFNL